MVVLKVVLPVTLIPIRPCHLKQKVGEICQCNFHTVRNWSQLWTCNPCEFRRWDQNCGRLHTPRITVSQEWLNGSLTRIQGGKSGAWSLFYQVGTACSTRWARGCNTHCLVRCARSKLPRADHNGWVEGIVTNRVDTGGALSYIHSYAFCEPLIWNKCKKVVPFCHILCPCGTNWSWTNAGMWFP